MRKTMFCSIIIILSMLYSCKEAEILQPTNDNYVILTPPGFTDTLNSECAVLAGNIHNSTCDYIYNYLDSNSIDISQLSTGALDTLLCQLAFEYATEEDDYLINNCPDLSNITFSDIYGIYKLTIQDSSLIPFEFQQLSFKIDSVLENNTSVASILSGFNDLDLYVKNTVPFYNEELRLLLWMCIDVAKQSLIYWSGNSGDAWEEYLDNLPPRAKEQLTLQIDAATAKKACNADVDAFIGAASSAAAGAAFAGKLALNATVFIADVLIGTMYSGGNPIGGFVYAIVKHVGKELAVMATAAAGVSACYYLKHSK